MENEFIFIDQTQNLLRDALSDLGYTKSLNIDLNSYETTEEVHKKQTEMKQGGKQSWADMMDSDSELSELDFEIKKPTEHFNDDQPTSPLSDISNKMNPDSKVENEKKVTDTRTWAERTRGIKFQESHKENQINEMEITESNENQKNFTPQKSRRNSKQSTSTPKQQSTHILLINNKRTVDPNISWAEKLRGDVKDIKINDDSSEHGASNTASSESGLSVTLSDGEKNNQPTFKDHYYRQDPVYFKNTPKRTWKDKASDNVKIHETTTPNKIKLLSYQSKVDPNTNISWADKIRGITIEQDALIKTEKEPLKASNILVEYDKELSVSTEDVIQKQVSQKKRQRTRRMNKVKKSYNEEVDEPQPIAPKIKTNKVDPNSSVTWAQRVRGEASTTEDQTQLLVCEEKIIDSVADLAEDEQHAETFKSVRKYRVVKKALWRPKHEVENKKHAKTTKQKSEEALSKRPPTELRIITNQNLMERITTMDNGFSWADRVRNKETDKIGKMEQLEKVEMNHEEKSELDLDLLVETQSDVLVVKSHPIVTIPTVIPNHPWKNISKVIINTNLINESDLLLTAASKRLAPQPVNVSINTNTRSWSQVARGDTSDECHLLMDLKQIEAVYGAGTKVPICEAEPGYNYLWLASLKVRHNEKWLQYYFRSYRVHVVQAGPGFAICKFPTDQARRVVMRYNGTRIDGKRITVMPSDKYPTPEWAKYILPSTKPLADRSS
eukprot:NODE_687_length_2459_cov_57.587329_g589_i0.p1 GENE.NODE_687_length_2459_cov_57.587329_g589_i0~~NODE_687_length_2459_cov_57.587329_g589_i0.p1  ORF type:complete len:738 (-),score=142.14 NODE_687_length_2459_cov_57.587329_g589_i0:245-2419(-)